MSGAGRPPGHAGAATRAVSGRGTKIEGMTDGEKNSTDQNAKTLGATPNSDIASLPGAHRDVQEGVEPLTPAEQLVQLNNFFEDNYPEIFRSLTTDEGAEYTQQGQPVPQELTAATERMWSKVPDLLTHSSQLVLGAGLDHAMPHVAFCREGISSAAWPVGQPGVAELPQGVGATVLRPDEPTGALAISLHGGPGWFGDQQAHEQLWQPLFAALAQQSGVTIVDLTYPLPLAGGDGARDWEATVAAVGQAFDAVRGSAEALGCDEARAGIVAFGSGLVAAAQALREAAWVAALSPRIAGPLEELEGEKLGIPALHSIASEDSRATPAERAASFAKSVFSEVDTQEFLSEHIIAPPTVWRERVGAAGQWLAGR